MSNAYMILLFLTGFLQGGIAYILWDSGHIIGTSAILVVSGLTGASFRRRDSPPAFV